MTEVKTEKKPPKVDYKIIENKSTPFDHWFFIPETFRNNEDVKTIFPRCSEDKKISRILRNKIVCRSVRWKGIHST
jgi:hypothetical protein